MENENKKVVIKGGCSLGTLAMLLGVAFIVLKLCKVIAWSWVWVLAPIWIYAAIIIVLMIVAVICAVIAKEVY